MRISIPQMASALATFILLSAAPIASADTPRIPQPLPQGASPKTHIAVQCGTNEHHFGDIEYQNPQHWKDAMAKAYLEVCAHMPTTTYQDPPRYVFVPKKTYEKAVQEGMTLVSQDEREQIDSFDSNLQWLSVRYWVSWRMSYGDYLEGSKDGDAILEDIRSQYFAVLKTEECSNAKRKNALLGYGIARYGDAEEPDWGAQVRRMRNFLKCSWFDATAQQKVETIHTKYCESLLKDIREKVAPGGSGWSAIGHPLTIAARLACPGAKTYLDQLPTKAGPMYDVSEADREAFEIRSKGPWWAKAPQLEDRSPDSMVNLGMGYDVE